MTVNVANTELTNTFEYWRSRTNELATLMSNAVITTTANSLTAQTAGNAAISGRFSANSLTAANVYTNSVLTVNISTINTMSQDSWFLANTTVIHIGNNQANTTLSPLNVRSNTVNVGDNVAINTASLQIVYSTSNLVANATKITLQSNDIVNSISTASSLVISNNSINSALTYNALKIGNSSATIVTVNTTAIATTSNIATLGTTLYIVSGGNVGISNSNPLYKLYVGGTAGNFAVSDDSDSGRGIRIDSKFNSNSELSFIGTSSAVKYLIFGIDGVEKMRLNTSGNFGVGTEAGSAYKFAAYGITRGLQVSSTTGATISRYDDNSNVTPLFVKNLGITATNHGTGLSFNIGSDASTSYNAGGVRALAEGIYTSTTNTQNSSLSFTTSASGTDNEWVRITSNGNVGFGNSVPAHKISVLGNSYFSQNVFVVNTVNAASFTVGSSYIVNSTIFQANSSSGTANLTSTGLVIGVSNISNTNISTATINMGSATANVVVTNSAFVAQNSTFTTTVNAAGISTNGNIRTTANLTVNGVVTIPNTVYINDLTVSGNLTYTGVSTANVVPDGDNTRALGDSTKRWADVWAYRISAVDAVTVNANMTVSNGGSITVGGSVNTTIANSSLSVNGHVIANSTGLFVANTINATSMTVSNYAVNSSGIYHTTVVNTAAFTATNFTANTTGVYHNIVSVGGTGTTNVVANSTSIKIANSSTSLTITNPTSTQVSNNNFFLNANGSWSWIYNPTTNNTITTTGTTAQQLDSYQMSTIPGAEYIISVVDNNANNRYMSKVLTTHDRTNGFMTEYAQITTNTSVGTISFAAAANLTHAVLSFTPTSTNTTVKIIRTIL